MQRHSCLLEHNQVINLRQDDEIIEQTLKSLQENEDMIPPEDSEVKIEEIINEPEEDIQKTITDIGTTASQETSGKIKRKETRGRKKKTADFFVDPEVSASRLRFGLRNSGFGLKVEDSYHNDDL